MAGEKIIDGVSSKENVSDKHEWVKEQVKTELNDLKMDVHGFYESDPANPEKIKYNLDAVKKYLGELCKSVEGKSDKEAWQYLKEKASRSYAWIMAVQIALESLGEGWDTDVNKIDGLLGGTGSHTRTAVRKFQDKWNENHEDKLNPDGLPGRATIKALLEAMEGTKEDEKKKDEEKKEDEKKKDEEKKVEIVSNDDLDKIKVSDLGKWEGGELKFNDGVLDEETGDLTINDKVVKKLEEGASGFGYVKKEGLLSIGNFNGGFLNGKGVEFDDYGNEYRGEWKDGLLYNGVHVSEVEDVKFFYEVKEGKSVRCYVNDTLSIDMEKIGENVYLKYGENSLKLKNPYSAQVILKMLWDYKDKEGEFVSDFQQPNKLFRKGKDGNKKVVYNTVDGLIDSAVVPGGILAGWLNDYRQSEKEKIEDANRVKVEGVGKFVENQFVFADGVEKEENGKKYIEFGGKRYYENEEGMNGLGYKVGINNNKIGWLYMGEYENGICEGKGTYTWANGDKYEGEYENGIREGKGTYTWSDGAKYEGEWKNNIREGKGTYTWSNGNKYEGEYENGERTTGMFILNPGNNEVRYGVERTDGKSVIVSGGDGSKNGKFVWKGEIVDKWPSD